MLRFDPRRAVWLSIAGLLLCHGLVQPHRAAAAEPAAAGPQLSHAVYFALKDPTPENRQKLVDDCKKYCTGHPGEVYFDVGTLSDLNRDVNDRDFDVALHIVFENKAAHDAYLVADRHKQLGAIYKDSFKKIRVFDSYLDAK